MCTKRTPEWVPWMSIFLYVYINVSIFHQICPTIVNLKMQTDIHAYILPDMRSFYAQYENHAIPITLHGTLSFVTHKQYRNIQMKLVSSGSCCSWFWLWWTQNKFDVAQMRKNFHYWSWPQCTQIKIVWPSDRGSDVNTRREVGNLTLAFIHLSWRKFILVYTGEVSVE